MDFRLPGPVEDVAALHAACSAGSPVWAASVVETPDGWVYRVDETATVRLLPDGRRSDPATPAINEARVKAAIAALK